MDLDSPYGDGYNATDGSQYYTPKIMNGLKAILEHGYPASSGGFTDTQAQCATANAIRFFLAENGIQEMPAFLRDTNNSRPKPGYEALFNWCLQLLEYGRHPGTDRSITFSPSDLTLEFTETAFEGDATVTLTNLNGGYTLDTSAFPAGTNITGTAGTGTSNITRNNTYAIKATIKNIGTTDPMGDITPTSLELTVNVATWALNITQDVTFD